ncbi:MAG: outer membrane protein assembly factor BamB family protein [Planctomycetota bacterium]|jgi:outer membrane protein assembly factor BamB
MNYLYIGCNGFVSAVDPTNGREVWRTDLDGGAILSNTSGRDVNVVEDSGIVIAGVNGLIFGINAQNGDILWKNKLTGMGYNDVTLSIGGKTIQTVGKPKESD